MERAALFVDAGYLLAGAHDLLGGVVTRSAYDCKHEDLLPALQETVEKHSGGMPFLRTYWYDGARDGLPTPEHRSIGELPYVKVRLGRLNQRGQQKGVDGLIYRDLTALARAGAIQRAYLFTGDEDLRESVVAAQDLGVQVVLITYKPTQKTGRSAALVREVDEVVVLDKKFWEPHFTARESVTAASTSPPDEAVLEQCAGKFAEQWADGSTREEVVALLDQAPNVPKDMYVQLVLAAEKQVGSLRTQFEAKGKLRSAFWKALKRHHKQQKNGGAEATAAASTNGDAA